MKWASQPNVKFALAVFAGPCPRVSGWKCSLHSVDGFAVHRGTSRYQWRVSHVPTGRLIIEGELDQSRESVVAAAEDWLAQQARRKGYSDPAHFLRGCLWHQAEGERRYEEAVAAAEGVQL